MNKPIPRRHQTPGDLFRLFSLLLAVLAVPVRAEAGGTRPNVVKGAKLPERPLFWHYPHYSNQGGPPHGAVRLGDYKLIEWYEDMSVELFNLKDDIGEHHDLSLSEPKKTDELTRLLHDWRDSIKAQMPTANPDYKPNANEAAQEK